MIKTYFNTKAAIWDEEIAEKDPAKLAKMAARLNIEKGARVLDVGTGTGIFIPYLQKLIGESGLLAAIDIAENMLEKSLAKNHQGNIVYLQADIMYAPLAHGQFDVVVCYSSFPHFQNKIKALSEIAQVLKNGGGLYLCHTSSKKYRTTSDLLSTRMGRLSFILAIQPGSFSTGLTAMKLINISKYEESRASP